MDARERVAPERRASIILGPFGKGEQWHADAIKLASQQIKEAEQAAYERAAALQCQECAEGDKPAWNEQCKYFYHHEGTNLEIGCPASSIHRALAQEPAEVA